MLISLPVVSFVSCQLGNMACDTCEQRDRLLTGGAMPLLLQFCNKQMQQLHPDEARLRNVTWAISNLCRSGEDKLRLSLVPVQSLLPAHSLLRASLFLLCQWQAAAGFRARAGGAADSLQAHSLVGRGSVSGRLLESQLPVRRHGWHEREDRRRDRKWSREKTHRPSAPFEFQRRLTRTPNCQSNSSTHMSHERLSHALCG